MAPGIFRLRRSPGGKVNNISTSPQKPTASTKDSSEDTFPELLSFDRDYAESRIPQPPIYEEPDPRIAELEEENLQLKAELETKSHEALSLQKTVGMLGQACDEYRDSVDRVQGRLHEAKAKANEREEPKGAILAARKEISSLHEELSSREKELAELRREMATLRRDRETEKEEAAKIKAQSQAPLNTTQVDDRGIMQSIFDRAGLSGPSTGLFDDEPISAPESPRSRSQQSSQVEEFIQNSLLRDTGWWDLLQASHDSQVQLLFKMEQGPTQRLARNWIVTSSQVLDARSIAFSQGESMGSSLTSLTQAETQTSSSTMKKSVGSSKATTRSKSSSKLSKSKQNRYEEELMTCGKRATRKDKDSRKPSRSRARSESRTRSDKQRSSSRTGQEKEKRRSSSRLRSSDKERSSSRVRTDKKPSSSKPRISRSKSTSRVPSPRDSQLEESPTKSAKMQRRGTAAPSGQRYNPLSPGANVRQQQPNYHSFSDFHFDSSPKKESNVSKPSRQTSPSALPSPQLVDGRHATIVCEDELSNASSLSSGSHRRQGRLGFSPRTTL